MADIERVYNIPLRKEWLGSPRYRRAKRAITAIKTFLAKHMKSENVLLGQGINLDVWKHGVKNPPHHIKVVAKKDAEGVVRAEIVGKDYAVVKQKAKKQEDTSLIGKLKHKMGVDELPEEEEKAEEKKEPKADKPAQKDAKKSEAKPEKPAEKKPEAKPAVKPEAKPAKAEAKEPKKEEKKVPGQQTLNVDKPVKKA